VGCTAVLHWWSHYERRAVRGADGVRLAPLPVARFLCPEGHGTTSWLPPFLQRYLHYAASVVECAVVKISLEGQEVEDVVELDGPSKETLTRWNVELTSLPVREWILNGLSGLWPGVAPTGPWPERAFTWEVARRFASERRLGLQFLSVLLQRVRLALMKRYAVWHS
jgi:hypothetical protein